MEKKHKNLIINLFFFIIILFFLTYRDLLDSLKFHLYYFYNERMLPLDPYYKIILFYDNLIDENIGYPWETRYIGNLINFLYYKIFPCLSVREIPEFINEKTYCSIWSVVSVNYFFSLASLISIFFYTKLILKRSNLESLIGLFVSYFLINFLNKYGIDRISIFVCILFFVLKSNTMLRFSLLFISILINEKLTILFSAYYFCQFISEENIKYIFHYKKNKYFYEMIICGISIIFYIALSLSLISLEDHSGGMLATARSFFINILSFHYVSNALIPTILLVFPHFYYLNQKKVLQKLNIKNSFFIIYAVFFLLGVFAGGSGNAGRYMIFLLPITAPLLSYLIIDIGKKIYKI